MDIVPILAIHNRHEELFSQIIFQNSSSFTREYASLQDPKSELFFFKPEPFRTALKSRAVTNARRITDVGAVPWAVAAQPQSKEAHDEGRSTVGSSCTSIPIACFLRAGCGATGNLDSRMHAALTMTSEFARNPLAQQAAAVFAQPPHSRGLISATTPTAPMGPNPLHVEPTRFSPSWVGPGPSRASLDLYWRA